MTVAIFAACSRPVRFAAGIGLQGVALAFGLATTTAADPAGRMAGEWSGTVSPDARLPPVPWTLQVAVGLGTAESDLSLSLVADLPGGSLRIDARSASSNSALTWDLPAQSLALDELLPVAALLRPDLAELPLRGPLRVTGGGTWRDGSASGLLQLGWIAPEFAWSAHEVVVGRPVLAVAVNLDDSTLGDMVVDLTWDALTVGGLTAGKGLATARREPVAGVWQLDRAELALWGGVVRVAAQPFDPAQPALRFRLSFDGVEAAELVKLLPEALASASGRLNGTIELGWTPDAGFVAYDGRLDLVESAATVVQLAPSPGLLSARVPARIATMPAWLGPVGRWFAVENPARAELEEIELGQRRLHVESLEIRLQPDGVGGRRSAMVRLVARPVNSVLVERIDFTVNVTGPLQELIELGFDDRARVRVGP